MTNLLVKIQSFLSGLREERGQDLVEYALFSGLIAAAIIAVGVAGYSGMLTGLMEGLKGCVDFKAGSCNPF
jgi:Flp pilus assembly pilin Flp